MRPRSAPRVAVRLVPGAAAAALVEVGAEGGERCLRVVTDVGFGPAEGSGICRCRPGRVAELGEGRRIAAGVARTQHRLVVETIDDPGTRQELAVAGAGVGVLGYVAVAADVDVSVRGVEVADALAVGPVREAVDLPPQPERDGEGAVDLPGVLEVGRPGVHVDRVRIEELFHLAGPRALPLGVVARGHPEQEGRPGVEPHVCRCGRTLQHGGLAAEDERAAHRLERPALGWKWLICSSRNSTPPRKRCASCCFWRFTDAK
jgi:hypothetical protein